VFVPEWMSGRTRLNSVNSLSPVSPSRLDVVDAFDIMNSSVDSSLVQKMVQTVHGNDLTLTDNPVAVIEKCRGIIDDLQFELDAERTRVVELESTVQSLRADLDAEKKKLREERSLVEQLRRHRNQRDSSHSSLVKDLEEARKQLADRDMELENMTQYCEKRVSELRRAVKEASSSLSTPPLSSQNDENRVGELTRQLAQSNLVLRSKDTELQTVVESYDKQVKLLRNQLRSTEELLARITPGVVVPDSSDWKGFIDGEFKKLNKTSLSYGGGPNPFSNLN
jgi:hypothetical protein